MLARISAFIIPAALVATCLAGCASQPDEPAEAAVSADHPPVRDDFLDRLVGRWRIERSMPGAVVQNTMDARWVLGHQFVQMHMIDVQRPAEYEAIVLVGYDARKKMYVAHWCDVFGAGYSAVGHGARRGDSVEFTFAYDDGPFFNTFTWRPESRTWTFRGENGQPDGSRKLFMQDVATKR